MIPQVAFLLLAACSGTLGADGQPGASCDPPETALADACACADPTVEIGSGASTFETVADGDAVTMVHGPQGGWHILGSARFANLLPIVSIHYTIAVEGREGFVSDNLYRVQMVQDTECEGYYPGMYGYLDVSALASGDADTPPELLGGAALVLRMEVADTEGRTAFDELGLVAALDPVDAASTDTGDSGAPE